MRSDSENLIDDLVLTDNPGWSGNVEAPTGFFAVGEITADDLERARVHGQQPTLKPGWYLAWIESDGFIGWTPFESESEARAAFDRLDEEYAGWQLEDEAYGN